MRILMSAGEASGDLHGSYLAREIMRHRPDARIYGMGGPLMAKAGVDVLYDPTRQSAVGFTEALKSVRPLQRILRQLAVLLVEDKPDVFVAIDFPGFNLKLARQAHHANVPAVYYMSPSVWAWGSKRAELIANLGMTVCSVFPFEADFYRKAGADVVYIGHPLIDIARSEKTVDEARLSFGLDPDRPVLGLLPGSRDQELRTLLPHMVDAYLALKASIPGLQAILPVAHTAPVDLVRALLRDAPVHVVEGQIHDALRASNAAVVASGTATLEAAILGVPQVVVYRISRLSYAIARRLVTVSHISLPNIVAGHEIVPELLQDAVNGPTIAAALRPMLVDPDVIQRIRRDYENALRRLGQSGAVARGAKVVLAVAAGEPVDLQDFAAREV